MWKGYERLGLWLIYNGKNEAIFTTAFCALITRDGWPSAGFLGRSWHRTAVLAGDRTNTLRGRSSVLLLCTWVSI